MGNFSLLTLNCFGAPGVNTLPRLRRLGHTLNDSDYAVVCLQEVQTHAYRNLITSTCSAHYPSQVYQPFIHAPKGGLLTLARMPIARSEFVLFQERRLWYTPAITDWILHKGVLITEFEVDSVPIVVMNTHLTANYMGDWSHRNMFAQQEARELTQIASLVNAQASDRLVIVCGDMNVPRGSWLTEALIDATGLWDPLEGDQRPTFRPHIGMGRRYGAPIDFTLYRPPANLDLEVESELCFADKVDVDGRKMHLSDHLAVEARFQWTS